MARYKYGIKSCIVSDIDETTGGAVAGGTEILEDIYRDTFTIAQATGTETEHYSEMNDTPKLSFTEIGKRTVSFSLLDTRPESLARFLGGEVVEADGVKKWEAPTTSPYLEKHFVLTMVDDTKLTIPRGSVVALTNFQIRRNAPALIDVTITPLQPEFAGLGAFIIEEPTA